MKKIFFWLFLSLIIYSCSSNKGDEAVLSGKFLNKPDSFGLLTAKGISDTIHISDDGSFRFSKILAQPSYFTLRVGRVVNSIYLSPGDSLIVSLDLENRTNEPAYSGSLAEINSYLHKAGKISRGLTSDFRGLYSKQQDEFVAKIDSVKGEVLGLLKASDINNKHFESIENERLAYFSKSLQFDYPNYNARIQGKNFSPDSVDYSFMNDFNMNNADMLHINEYANLITSYIETKNHIESLKPSSKGKSRFEMNVNFFEMIDSLIQNLEVRDFVKHQIVVETVQWEKFEDAKNLVEHFMKEVTILPYKDIVTRAYANRLLLSPGVDAPTFTLNGIDGKTYSLSDFKGKLVYIDFWASWCSPCRAEIPFLLKLKEAYKDKPVAFVAISLDDDIDAWKKMVEEKQLKGYQLHAEKAWSSDVAKNYQIKGVPTFVLIDGDGKIIEYNTARPSDPEISLVLDKNLKAL